MSLLSTCLYPWNSSPFPVFSLFHAFLKNGASRRVGLTAGAETRAPGQPVHGALEGRESGLSSRFVLPTKLTAQLKL